MTHYQFVGIDIAKEKFDAVILQHQTILHRIFDNKPSGFKRFVAWLKQQSFPVWACMESTGHYGEPLAEYLYRQSIAISVVNPLQIKQFAKLRLARNKNDRVDAQMIAEYCSYLKPRLFTPRPMRQKATRELTQLIDTLKQQLQQLKNQLESTQSDIAKKALKQTIGALEKQINALEKKLAMTITQESELHEKVALLITIKGIGLPTAYRIVAYLPDLNLFKNAKQFAAFIGVTPKQHQSGKLRGKTCMSHFGHARFKKVLYMPALVAKNSNEHLKPFVTRLKHNGLSPKAIVGAVMRKLAHLIFGILKSKQPFNAKLACLP